jgi:pimeloyl-ACP methyl ester carboxylesterase
MPLGYFLTTHWKKIACGLSVVLVVAPFCLLHLFVLAATIFEPKLKAVTAARLPTRDGHSLQIFQRETPGAGVSLVFVHGSPATAHAFHAQFKDPPPDTTLIAYDRPGFGGSEGSAATRNLRAQVDALLQLLEGRPAAIHIVIGHSYGAPIALQAAIERPDLVQGIVLVGGSVDPGLETVKTVQRIAAWPPIRALIPSTLDNCNLEILQLHSDLRLLAGKLGQLNVPVAMVHGLKDNLVPPANVAYLEQALASAGKSHLFFKSLWPDYNHFIPWEHPEAVALAIAQIRNQCSPNRPGPVPENSPPANLGTPPKTH